MTTWHIHIEGQVQGVGFRPYVYGLARLYQLNGWVNNTSDGVHVEIRADEEKACAFYKELIAKAPRLSRITRHRMYPTAQKCYENFQILQSQFEASPQLLLTPDFAMCDECRAELGTDHHRRKDYGFITCTQCGPRFSIIQALPYDRKNTTMAAFEMCPACAAEYNNPGDRRYYSQTNSCQQCGIQLTLFDRQLQEIANNTDSTMDTVVRYWREGKIVAIKGIGGYLLTCDANNKEAIQRLRKRKYRPDKPLALMYPDVAMLGKVVEVRKEEKEALESPVAPIVLLPLKKEAASCIMTQEIAPGLSQIGVMLPYTPLYHLLLEKFGKPVVATSGNMSNAPILFEDDKAKKELFSLTDFILSHDRQIAVPQDDSVVQFTPVARQRIILRRSRGLAPTYINTNLAWTKQTILATGAMLKSSFSVLHRGNTYISQYLGNLGHFDTQENFRHMLGHFLKLFATKPEVILADKHPQYASTQYGERLAQELNVPFRQVQHHIAHFGAVLAENKLLHAREAVLGVVWDGTGYGDDRQIWGGEFFTYEHDSFFRAAHFEYFDCILGDKMAKEPRIAALAACWPVEGAEDFLKAKFTPTEWRLYTKMLQKGNALKTSSVGRIFDAVASLLGLSDVQSYEGEAALLLETLAWQYFQKNGFSFHESYFPENFKGDIPTATLMRGIVQDMKKGKSKSFIAAKLHFSFIKLVKKVANQLKIRNIAFSGGVFQNSLLVDLMIHYLKEEFALYFHQELSPNDENISFGQLVCDHIQHMKT